MAIFKQGLYKIKDNLSGYIPRETFVFSFCNNDFTIFGKLLMIYDDQGDVENLYYYTSQTGTNPTHIGSYDFYIKRWTYFIGENYKLLFSNTSIAVSDEQLEKLNSLLEPYTENVVFPTHTTNVIYGDTNILTIVDGSIDNTYSKAPLKTKDTKLIEDITIITT